MPSIIFIHPDGSRQHIEASAGESAMQAATRHDISGILAECVSRLRLGTAVTAVFDGTFSPSTIEGRVARSSVANVSKKGVLQYHIGIAFNKPIVLEAAAVAAAASKVSAIRLG